MHAYIYILVTYATTGSNNGLLPVHCQGIIWNNADILSVRPLRTKFSEISVKSWVFPLKKIHLKVFSIKYQPFCHSLCVLIFCSHHHGILFSVTWVHIFLVAKLVWRYHSSDITMSAQASQIPASPLFAQPFVQANIKENIKVLHHWSLWGEFTCDRWFSFTKGQWHGKSFYLMTSSGCLVGINRIPHRNYGM